MALLLFEGFELSTSTTDINTLPYFSASNSYSSITGRSGGRSIRMNSRNNSITLSLPSSKQTVIAGLGVRWSTLLNQATTLMGFRDGGTNQVDVRLDTGGGLSITRNGTSLDTGSTLSVNTWYYIEMKATIDNSSGSVEVRINGSSTPDMSFSGDTQNSGNATISNVLFQTPQGTSGNTTIDWDDIYICDNLGGFNDDFLGDCIVQQYLPNGAGTETDFSGAYTDIDDSSPDGDTTRIASSTTNSYGTYQMTNVTDVNTPDIRGVGVFAYAKKSDAGNRGLAPVIRSGTTLYDGTNTQLTVGQYLYYYTFWEEDPDTATQWTVAGINSAEGGVKATTT